MKMAVDDLFDAMVATYNALRRYGLQPSEITTYYPMTDPRGEPAFGFIVLVDGKRWNGAVADCNDREGFEREWKRFSEDGRALTEARFEHAWATYMPEETFAAIGLSLTSCDIPLRNADERTNELMKQLLQKP